MDIAQIIGQPEGPKLEYKAVLPPAATIAQLISSFANAEGGLIVLGVNNVNGIIKVNGLSDEFHAVAITRKALDLLAPKPSVEFQYLESEGKRLFAIEIQASPDPIHLGDRKYVRKGAGSVEVDAKVEKVLLNSKIKALRAKFDLARIGCTSAKAQVLDHYKSILNIMNDLSSQLFPDGTAIVTTNLEGKVLSRILFSSCADNFETYMSDLLFEIYLAKPETLKSESQIAVREVLECSDMEEFIRVYAKKRLSKLQRGSVKGFISDNKQISSLAVLDEDQQRGIEQILQIRHLYSHRNGLVDEKFQTFFPSASLNSEYGMTIDEFLEKCEYLLIAVNAVDKAALTQYSLALFA